MATPAPREPRPGMPCRLTSELQTLLYRRSMGFGGWSRQPEQPDSPWRPDRGSSLSVRATGSSREGTEALHSYILPEALVLPAVSDSRRGRSASVNAAALTRVLPRIVMIIVLKPHATPEVVDHVLERITALGFTPHLSQGVARTIIGVIGDEAKLQVEPLQAIPGVEQVVPILKPFKLASREFHPEGSVFEAKGIKIGGGHLAVIAGPCAIESEAILFEIADRVRDARGQYPSRRGVQAQDKPLQLSGARPRRAQDSSGRRPTFRHAGRYRSHGPPPG